MPTRIEEGMAAEDASTILRREGDTLRAVQATQATLPQCIVDEFEDRRRILRAIESQSLSEADGRRIEHIVGEYQWRTWRELQYVEAAARLDLAYDSLNNLDAASVPRHGIQSFREQTQQRLLLLEQTLHKWQPLQRLLHGSHRPKPASEDAGWRPPSLPATWCKFDVQLMVDGVVNGSYVLRLLLDQEQIVFVAAIARQSDSDIRRRLQASFKAQGHRELEVQLLESASKHLMALSFLPLNELTEFEPSEIIFEPLNVVKMQLRVERAKRLPSDGPKRRPAILRRRQRKDEQKKTPERGEYATASQHAFRDMDRTVGLRKCAACDDLLFPWHAGVQCLDCRYVCHRRCLDHALPKPSKANAPKRPKIIMAPCVMGAAHRRGFQEERQQDDDGFDGPRQYQRQHRPQPATVLRPTWCGHCGELLSFGGSNAVRCDDCHRQWHAACIPLVPATCGILQLVDTLTSGPDHAPLLNFPPPSSCQGIDKYDLLACLGRGNFGKVLLARLKGTCSSTSSTNDPGSWQDSGPKIGFDPRDLVAIKVLKKAQIQDNDEYENVKTEQRVLELAHRHRHPFIVALRECFQDPERVYFVLEYAPGGDLLFHIQADDDRHISLEDKRYVSYDDHDGDHIDDADVSYRMWMAQVLLALHFLHSQGVIYRDLKLDNLLLDAEGNVRLADFGLSKDGLNARDGATSTFCGTPEFIAPEIYRQQQPYTRSVDWWAYGVLLYQLITQRVCPP
jgi:hypothetical protein